MQRLIVITTTLLLAVIIFSVIACYSNLSNAYYIFSGIGGIAAIFFIFITNQQVQTQIKKDIFLRNAEFIIDELYAYVVEISYHWAHQEWENYALDINHNGPIEGKFGLDKYSDSMGDIHSVCRRGHQNRITLALHTRNRLKGLKDYKGLHEKGAISQYAKFYIEKFDMLIKEAKKLDCDFSKIYENSFLAELRDKLNDIINQKS